MKKRPDLRLAPSKIVLDVATAPALMPKTVVGGMVRGSIAGIGTCGCWRGCADLHYSTRA
jgi:hypothetical protein